MNRNALIIGGTRGIGLAVAELLAEQGAGVVLNGRDPATATQAAERIPGAVAHPGSPANPDGAQMQISFCGGLTTT